MMCYTGEILRNNMELYQTVLTTTLLEDLRALLYVMKHLQEIKMVGTKAV
jgi:hypothetical protein